MSRYFILRDEKKRRRFLRFPHPASSRLKMVKIYHFHISVQEYYRRGKENLFPDLCGLSQPVLLLQRKTPPARVLQTQYINAKGHLRYFHPALLLSGMQKDCLPPAVFLGAPLPLQPGLYFLCPLPAGLSPPNVCAYCREN